MIPSRLRDLRRGELGGLAGDSFFVAIWQGAVSAADLVQIALITHALGLEEYGRLALVIGVVMLVGQFFDVRVGAAATTFGARALRLGGEAPAQVFQFSYLIDMTTGVLGFLVVCGLAPFVGPSLVGDDGTVLILLYAVTLLVATGDDSSVSVLRLLDRFKLIAGYTVILELLRVGLIVLAVVIWESLVAVVLALLAYRTLTAAANTLAAVVSFRRREGESLLTGFRRAASLPERREMLRMVLHTNVVSYARLAQTNLPTVLVGAIAGATQAGLYKVGMSAAVVVGRLSDPAYAALLPRISRLWAAERRGEVRRLIERATLVSVPAMAVALVLLIAFRSQILSLLGGDDAQEADTVLILAGVAAAVSGALFWNIGVLYATGQSNRMARVALISAAIQLALLAPLVLAYEASGAALAYMASMVVSNLVAGVWALTTLRRQPKDLPAGPTGPIDLALRREGES